MLEDVLLSTAYLPPVRYFSALASGGFIIEKHENYIKQTYRNRCYIMTAHGSQALTVPVLRATVHKVPVSEVKIDYSKRWQQVHLRAMTAAYKSSPFFDFYFDDIERIISENHELLLNLNNALLEKFLQFLGINREIRFTESFQQPEGKSDDFRYSILPGSDDQYLQKKYYQVFESRHGFIPDMSIVDLVFNMGPRSAMYL
jgi:hypothetical protein